MNKPPYRRNCITSYIFAVALFFFILSFSIGLPIYFRPFYYAHIDSLELSEKSGFTESEIRETYDAVLDYLTLPGKEFSTGIMAHSPDGEMHFADCKALFNLNAAILLFSFATLLILIVLRRSGKVAPFRLGGYSSGFWAAIFAIAFPVIIGGLAAINFDLAFTVFHKIFFAGKENWRFDYRTDEIIRVLPQEFFMHCAILIGASILLISAVIILTELLNQKNNKK